MAQCAGEAGTGHVAAGVKARAHADHRIGLEQCLGHDRVVEGRVLGGKVGTGHHRDDRRRHLVDVNLNPQAHGCLRADAIEQGVQSYHTAEEGLVAESILGEHGLAARHRLATGALQAAESNPVSAA